MPSNPHTNRVIMPLFLYKNNHSLHKNILKYAPNAPTVTCFKKFRGELIPHSKHLAIFLFFNKKWQFSTKFLRQKNLILKFFIDEILSKYKP